MLVIYEIANNHGGNVNLGLSIINEFSEVATMFPQFTHCMKYQYRDIDGGTYIHPTADPEHKYVKRFKETNLSPGKRLLLRQAASAAGFKTACTPFDEASVSMVIEHEYDYLKVGSPSFTDWALWTEIYNSWNGYVLASTGGATTKEIDKVVSGCINPGWRGFVLMHCVSEYPTNPHNLHMEQIDWLIKRYNLPVGYSSHERGNKFGSFAHAYIAGARVFERHVCLDPPPNNYSVTPETMQKELEELERVHPPDGRIPGPKPTQFMRQMIDGRMAWKP